MAVRRRARRPASTTWPRRSRSAGAGRRSWPADGWVGVTWPEEYGGRGLGPLENYVVQEELARARAPELVGRIGINLVGPTLLAHGTEEQKARWLPAHPRRPTSCGASSSASPTPAATWPSLDHPGRAGRRRLARHRPEGVDLLRPVRRLGPVPDPQRPGRAQAPGASPPCRRHARRRASRCTRSCSHRRGRVQRGLPRRRVRPRRPASSAPRTRAGGSPAPRCRTSGASTPASS